MPIPFVSRPPDPSMCVTGPDGVLMVFDWDWRLVALSVGVAVGGSFAALEFAGRMRTADNRADRRRHFFFGAALMGLAVWTMHFVGMLALKMPMPVAYAPTFSAFSILAAATGAGLAFSIMARPRVTPFYVALGGLAMGVAIASMHYIGMGSMRMAATLNYEPFRFGLSIAIAVAASATALWMGYAIPKSPRFAFWLKAGSTAAMGFAISGMHYVGMSAARYEARSFTEARQADPMVGTFLLRDLVSVAELVFGAALIALAARSAVERERALADFRRLNEELERRVYERTAELEKTNSDLSMFSYSVSHDLRSPLRSIGGFAEVLVDSHAEQLDATGRGYLGRIRAAAERMDDLLNGILQLTRVSRADLQVSEVNLSELAHGILADLATAEPSRQVEVNVAEGMNVQADQTLIASVLQNLLDNAWKFTRNNPTARIEVRSKFAAGETVFFVRDNGAGFNPEHIGKLFGMFERLHTVSEFEGNGIGLALTKRSIERHGGKIWAESNPGKGATFFFTVPAASESSVPHRSSPNR
ncbi:MAG: MHYT domain-containing protein [Opitutaceae bacterium]